MFLPRNPHGTRSTTGRTSGAGPGYVKDHIKALACGGPDTVANLQWQTTAGTNGGISSTPTIANGVVYYADGNRGRIHAFDATTGTLLWSSGAEVGGQIFAAPIVVNGRLFAGSYDNHLHAWGL